MAVAFLQQPIDFPQCILAASPRPEAVTSRPELCLKDWLDGQFQCCLHDTVLDRRNPQWPRSSVAFGDLYPFGRVRPVAAILQIVMKFPQIPLRLGREPFRALAIHPRRPFVPRDLPPRGFEGCRSDDLVHQAEPFASYDAVNQRRHHALGPDRSFHPPPLSFVGLCPLLSPLRHCRDGSLLHSSPRTSSFLPPFPRSGFASRSFHRRRRHQYYEGSDSCRSHPDRQVSPLTPPCRPSIPSSTTRAVRWSLRQSPQRQRLLPGFAINEQARHSVTPKQVRQPPLSRGQALRTAGSPPVALHPASRRRSYLRLRSLRPAPARTPTVLTKRPHGRTHGPAWPGHQSGQTATTDVRDRPGHDLKGWFHPGGSATAGRCGTRSDSPFFA